jgi:hypothetical protein
VVANRRDFKATHGLEKEVFHLALVDFVRTLGLDPTPEDLNSYLLFNLVRKKLAKEHSDFALAGNRLQFGLLGNLLFRLSSKVQER